MTFLRVPQPPRLPNAPLEYAQRHHDQHSDVLRLYFNQLSSNIAALAGVRGGQYVNNPYGAFSTATDVNFAASNTATKLSLGVADYQNGTSLSSGGIAVAQSGLYNLQFSIQFVNTDSQAHNTWVWLRKNSTNIVGTGSKYDVPAKHGSSDGYLIAVANFYVDLVANDVVYLYAATSQALVGPTPGVYAEAYAAQTSPFAMPSIPSVVATLSFVSSLAA